MHCPHCGRQGKAPIKRSITPVWLLEIVMSLVLPQSGLGVIGICVKSV